MKLGAHIDVAIIGLQNMLKSFSFHLETGRQDDAHSRMLQAAQQEGQQTIGHGANQASRPPADVSAVKSV
jgi:hypothetical protein